MAEQTPKAVEGEAQSRLNQSADAPVLNPGYRPPAPEQRRQGSAPRPLPEAASAAAQDSAPADENASEAPATQKPDPAPTARQALETLRQTLKNCNRLLLVDESVLQMPNWPDDRAVAMARRFRDLWMLGIVFCSLLLTAGMVSFLPAWLGGAGFGLLVVGLLMGTPPARRLFTQEPSYTQLLLKRYQLLSAARDHIRDLEGGNGLAWQCLALARYNRMLKLARYNGIRRLSQRGELVAYIHTRSHVRLYLMFIEEAQRAYHRAQAAYLDAHQKALDEGWLAPGPAQQNQSSQQKGD